MAAHNLWFVFPSCGPLPVQSHNCHSHVAITSRALYSFRFQPADILCWYLPGLLSILRALNKVSRCQQNQYRKTKAIFQKSAASFPIHSVLLSLLFILKSPNIAFKHFAVSIASPVTLKEQESWNRKQQLKHSPNWWSNSCNYYTHHKTVCTSQNAVIAQTIRFFLYSHQSLWTCTVMWLRQCTTSLFTLSCTKISRLYLEVINMIDYT